MANNRIQWIDTMKYFCILFVIVSHVGNNNDVSPVFLSTFYKCFFLTGFLFASGYTYSHKLTFAQHMKRKTGQLLIPWMKYSFLIVIFNNLVTRHPENHNFILEILHNALQIRKLGDEMWFVLALFVSYLPFYFVVEIYEKNKDKCKITKISSFVLLVLLIFYQLYIWFMPVFPWGNNRLPWHIEYIPYAISFMMMGYMFKGKFEQIFDQFWNKTRFAFFISIFFLVTYLPFALPIIWSNWMLDTVYVIITTVMGTGALIWISKKIKGNKYISFVGQNTLNYFGLHRYTNNIICNYVTPIFISLVTIKGNPIIAAAYAIFVGLIETVLLIYPSIMVNKWLPSFAGKREI